MTEITYEHTPETPYSSHEYAELFPMIEGRAFDELVEDVRVNGVREPIIFLGGKVLDGRNRYFAARKAGIRYPRVEFEGDDPLSLVISLNLNRRHLSESQRAMVASKLSNLPRGGADYRTANLQTDTSTRKDAARMLNVSERSVNTAKSVERDGAPELVNAVETGKVSVSAAADVATLPREEQQEIVAKGEKEILQAAKKIRAKKAVFRREERLDNLAEIAKGNAELGTDTKYPVIYADPPWRYENPPIGASSRSIENHYPTMTLEDICALPVGDLCTDDAILYLWATAPKLAECLKVLEAWGFEYRTNLCWDKEVIGMGYHARNQHELLLIAKRGSLPPPQAGTQPSSIHREKRGEHSAKPSFYYEMIESAYPQLPKIELFCRSPRDGWEVWGNQSGGVDAVA